MFIILIFDFYILDIIFMEDFIICWDTSAVHIELEKLIVWKLHPLRGAVSTETSVFFGGGSENGISIPTYRGCKNLSLRSEEERHRQRREVTWRWKRRLEGCRHKPRDAGSPQKLEEAGRSLPWTSWGSRTLALISDFYSPELLLAVSHSVVSNSATRG